MLLPYRAKNPPERFPYITIGIILINVLVYVFTTESLLEIRDDVVRDWALSSMTFSPMRMLSAMFLHLDLVHLLGNMLFLWIFGSSVEGRIGHISFLIIYLVCGSGGDVMHELAVGSSSRDYTLGASGAIMGIAGAYLYMFPYSRICVLYSYSWRIGTADWHARWVVLLYVGLDLLMGVLLKAQDGVGHFAHLGGAATGFVLMLILRPRRDDETRSDAQAMRSELKDYHLMAYKDLHTLIQHPTDDFDLIWTFIHRSITGGVVRQDEGVHWLKHYWPLLMAKADPVPLAQLVAQLREYQLGLPAGHVMRLAGRAEAAGQFDTATALYKRVMQEYASSPDAEMAMFRTAGILERIYRNRDGAVQLYIEILRQYPHGALALDVRRALGR